MIYSPIVFSINNAYAPYLWICLKSLLAHVQARDRYQAYVLHTSLSETHKQNILSLQTNNLSIEFIDVKLITEKYNGNFLLNAHFTIETYYRFFLPQIFPNLDKVLYLDADTMVMQNIAPLYEIELKDNYVGVTHDCEIIRISNFAGEKYSDYFTKTLGVNVDNYFQAGVMLMNLKKMREDNITDNLLAALKKIRTPKFVDQDILNIVCQNKVKFIPQNWNYTWHLPLIDEQYGEHIPHPLKEEFEKAKNNPYIIHFTGNKMKPVDYPNARYSEFFWHYAQQSIYYEHLIKQKENSLLQINHKIKQIKYKIKKYKLLNIITFCFFKNKIYERIDKKEADLKKILKQIQKD